MNYFHHSYQATNLPRTEENDGSPSSRTPYGLCHRCNKQSNFEITYSGDIRFARNQENDQEYNDSSLEHERNPVYIIDSVSPSYPEIVVLLRCYSCRQTMVSIERLVEDDANRLKYEAFHWWPSIEVSVSSDIPRSIASAYREAVRAYHSGCYRAAAVMARRTLEAVTEQKGEPKGPLVKRLKNLVSSQRIDPSLESWSREIRLVGNAGAHFDPINNVSKEDADDIISFIRQILRFLYEIPAEVARVRSRHKRN